MLNVTALHLLKGEKYMVVANNEGLIVVDIQET